MVKWLHIFIDAMYSNESVDVHNLYLNVISNQQVFMHDISFLLGFRLMKWRTVVYVWLVSSFAIVFSIAVCKSWCQVLGKFLLALETHYGAYLDVFFVLCFLFLNSVYLLFVFVFVFLF